MGRRSELLRTAEAVVLESFDTICETVTDWGSGYVGRILGYTEAGEAATLVARITNL